MIADDDLHEKRITGVLDGHSLDDVLNVIGSILEVSMAIDDNRQIVLVDKIK